VAPQARRSAGEHEAGTTHVVGEHDDTHRGVSEARGVQHTRLEVVHVAADALPQIGQEIRRKPFHTDDDKREPGRRTVELERLTLQRLRAVHVPLTNRVRPGAIARHHTTA
jgi:hypothetical protein